MSEEKKTCQGCKYFLADTHNESRTQFRCANQDSKKFGHEVPQPGVCDKHDRFNPRPDMPFKDALDQIVMGPDGSYKSWFFKFGNEGELSRPAMFISFVDNKQMLEYRDAMDRCFDELMKLKTEAGDFTEGNSKEQ